MPEEVQRRTLWAGKRTRRSKCGHWHFFGSPATVGRPAAGTLFILVVDFAVKRRVVAHRINYIQAPPEANH
jgi:hypothetical protein